MFSFSAVLGCQDGAGTVTLTLTLTYPPNLAERSFFSVKTDNSLWHQIDSGHIGLIILFAYVSVTEIQVSMFRVYKSLELIFAAVLSVLLLLA